MECEVVAVGETDVEVRLSGVAFSVPDIIRLYISFREWKVDSDVCLEEYRL